MGTYNTQYISEYIKRSSFGEEPFKTDVLFEEHILVWFISGEMKIVQGGSTTTFQAGDTLFFPRNQLVKVVNYPKDGLPHKAVTMHLTSHWLKEFYTKNKIQVKQLQTPGFRVFNKDPLLQSCLASLIPYFDLEKRLPEKLAALKMEEAVTILRTIDPDIDNELASFEDPGKIDLPGFMEKNYMYNMPLDKFGYLTGRSLTTFRRDFKRTFHTTPQKWLTQKRLELAYYELTEKKRRPVEVYTEAGFENLSHFSYAFKKHFGYAPNRMPGAPNH